MASGGAVPAALTGEKYVEPTYRLGPYPDKMFSPAQARSISEEVCQSILNGKEWTGEGDEAVWTVQITEKVKERMKG